LLTLQRVREGERLVLSRGMDANIAEGWGGDDWKCVALLGVKEGAWAGAVTVIVAMV
jgi:hypothetical protein